MPLIDTHSHIYLPDFKEDIVGVLQNAENEGVEKILLPAIDNSTHEQMLELEKMAPEVCLAMMGLHPCSVKENFREELKIAREHLDKRKFVAIGETGLDFYWDKTFTAEQYIAFNEQIEWAKEFDIPVVIHSRNSIDECIDVIKEQQDGRLKGVFHCFSGNEEQAGKIIDLGFYMGIGGVVTFKNSGLDKVMKEIDMKHIVLETDAPYLAPVPYRGKRNEPAYLKYIVTKISEIKGISTEEVADYTINNSIQLFDC
ncbi:MAG TPA: TatD family hydrolase [Chitinophagaceae bacterium]|nr:TatD family hydrolase [Chitinophagaceae bacterium]